ncbi:MAG: hypothetical protein RSB87_03700 [Clostridia bacterium]
MKKGISLIVLSVTIVVLTILAGVVVYNVTDRRIIDKANETVFKSDIIELNDQLEAKLSSLELRNFTFDKENINAETYADIHKYIENFPKKYDKKFKIQKGKLVYIGKDKLNETWVEEQSLIDLEK